MTPQSRWSDLFLRVQENLRPSQKPNPGCLSPISHPHHRNVPCNQWECSHHEVPLQNLFRVGLTVLCLYDKNAFHALSYKNSTWTELTQPKVWKQDLGPSGDCPSLVLLILWFWRHFLHEKEMCFVLLQCLLVFVWEIQDYKGTQFKPHAGCVSALYSATTSELPSCCVS